MNTDVSYTSMHLCCGNALSYTLICLRSRALKEAFGDPFSCAKRDNNPMSGSSGSPVNSEIICCRSNAKSDGFYYVYEFFTHPTHPSFSPLFERTDLRLYAIMHVLWCSNEDGLFYSDGEIYQNINKSMQILGDKLLSCWWV